jgi:bis(5'-nucleosyl)-tetraphosphatase (symmetrical)
MAGNEPHQWSPDLQNWDRYRFILNALTRMRYGDSDGGLKFSEKGAIGTQAMHLTPWFNRLHSENHQVNIIFGHWASLIGVSNLPHVFAIDTGCSWGYQLTALRLEDKKRFSVDKFK